jgi:hypothetical protein
MKNEIILEFKTSTRGSKNNDYVDNKWDLSNQLDIKEFLKQNPQFNFEKGADVISAPDLSPKYKILPIGDWKHKKYILYLLVINGKIVKGGKSKNPIELRSYGAGTQETWSMTGECSPTNYYYSQIFRQCILDGKTVEFYCMQAPIDVKEYDVFGKMVRMESSPYEEYEKVLNKKLVTALGRKPIGEGNLQVQYKD